MSDAQLPLNPDGPSMATDGPTFQRSVLLRAIGNTLSSRMLKKAVQQGRRRSKNRRRTLWGTLRILAS